MAIPKLLLQQQGADDDEIELGDGETVLGRDAGCDIVIKDTSVSRRHLKLRTLMGDAFLEDLGSANGTFVNGRLVKKCVLNDGDVIQVGSREILYRQPRPPAGSDGDGDELDKTQLIRPGEFGPRTAAAREARRETQGMSPMRESASRADRRRRRNTARQVRSRDQVRSEDQPQSLGLLGWLKRLVNR